MDHGVARDARALVARAALSALRPSVSEPPAASGEVLIEAARIAGDNKLIGELASALAASRAVPPVEVLGRIAQHRASARHKARQVLPTLRLVAATLAPAGIEWLAYKGHALQVQLGHNADHRATADLDILVRKADFDAAAALLRGAGMALAPECRTSWWRTWLGELTLTMPAGSGVPIDLHYKVQQPGCPEPRDTGRLVDRRTTVQLGDIAVPTLAPVDAALHAAICIAKALARHEPAGSHVVDFARMLLAGGSDFARELGAEASRQRLGQTVRLARVATIGLLGEGLLDHPGFAEAAFGQGGDTVPAADWQAVLLTPGLPDHAQIRGRVLLWALSDGRAALKAGRFVRDSIVVIAAEGSRRWSERAAS